MNQEELSDWLRGVAAEVNRTKPDYPHNVVRGCPTPFFGNVLEARALTVGVNPSNNEFAGNRHWTEPLKHAAWRDRLLKYFCRPGIPALAWFETWSICLELIGLSYAAGAAAHVDVSPRPTTPMLDEQTDKQEFRAMVEHDAKWFFGLLSRLPQVRLLLVAGPIPRANGTKQQLVDFIGEQAGQHGAKWNRGDPLSRLVLPGPSRGVSVFVCRYEREVDGLYSMVRQVYRNRELLRGHCGSAQERGRI